MLRMDGFSYVHAASWPEALALWSAHPEAMYVSGGTDLLPNVKHGLFKPRTLVGLSGIRGGVDADSDRVVIGATTCLDEVASNPIIRAMLPPLAQAAALVASPQIRAMGTLGGNVLLDTRCLYYNQTEFWRRSLGYCLKADGTWCHVVGGPKTCVAAQSSDTVPVLLALNAVLRLIGPGGARELPIRDLFRFNGMDHLAIAKGELLTDIVVPTPGPGFVGSYTKLRTRESIDFPQLGLALCATLEGGTLRSIELVLGAVNPQPKPIRGLEAFLGCSLDDAAIDAIADLVFKQTRPQESIAGDAPWRRQMAAVFTRRALVAVRAAGAA
ncbi:carbon-monoxide dehydrogenase medium subunit [Deltaproteobacteria bacterium]|nr:carbon-monoxide dehydrogenase medium subunit [Deltaproteobacteria bacterium]